MSVERWVVLAKLRGEFMITDQKLEATASPDQSMKKLEMAPEFDADQNYTGLHALTVDIDIENPDTSPLPSHVPLERAKEVAESIAAAISLAVGRPVKVISVSIRHDLPELGKHRLVAGAGQAVSIAPPSLLNPELLTVDLDRKVRRVIRWWARGIATDDGVDRLGALTTALDILAGDYDGVPGRTRTCAECGHIQQIGPGLRERVVSYLTEELSHDEETADQIYESRIDLAHGRSSLSEDDLRRFREHGELLARAIRDGLSKRLGIDLPQAPQALPFDLQSAALDVEYVDPPGQ